MYRTVTGKIFYTVAGKKELAKLLTSFGVVKKVNPNILSVNVRKKSVGVRAKMEIVVVVKGLDGSRTRCLE